MAAGLRGRDGHGAAASHALRSSWTDLPTLVPGLADDTDSGAIIEQLFSGLVELTPDMGIVPGVAAL